MKRTARICAALLIALVLITVFTGMSDSAIYNKTLRLHVLANSDSEADQDLKLKVRDAVLQTLKGIEEECTNADEAEEVLKNNFPEIQDAAEKVIADEGYDYDITLTLCHEYYPTKEYENISLPAGTYRSLKVIIGEGEGHNWWCVLYPPLCLSAASAEEELTEAGFTPDEVNIITGNGGEEYTVRFKILEVASEIWNNIFG